MLILPALLKRRIIHRKQEPGARMRYEGLKTKDLRRGYMYRDIYVDFTSSTEEKNNSQEAGARMRDEGLKT
jgi:hypothetical protein